AKPIKKYLNDELKKLKRYFDNNLEFYKYYRTNNSFVDDKLFVRGKHDIKLSLDTVYFETDHRFSTSHDYKVAKIIANDLIQVYLEDQLHNIIYENKSLDLPTLNWTGSKTALIELVYALHSQGTFDNGNADIKVIAKTFERTFDIDLGDFYHTFMELKSRKINQTKFLDSLRDALIKKMGEQD
ncbi:MAG: RteC domain-containing protein, partial [Lutibacter sp.]